MVLQSLARSRNLRSVCLEVFFGGWFCISESQIFLSLGLKVWNLGLTVLQSLKFTILHSFFCPFSIFNFQVGIFYVWNNCDTKHMFWFAEKLLCKLYHWTSKKTQKVCFHFKLFYKLKDQTKSFVGLLSWLHVRVVTRVRPRGCCQLFHHLHVIVMWRFLMLVSRKLGLLLDLFTLDNSPRKNPDIQISSVKFWKIK